MPDEERTIKCPVCGTDVVVPKEEPETPPEAESSLICPKCGQLMDEHADKVLVCGDCGWEIKPGG